MYDNSLEYVANTDHVTSYLYKRQLLVRTIRYLMLLNKITEKNIKIYFIKYT